MVSTTPPTALVLLWGRATRVWCVVCCWSSSMAPTHVESFFWAARVARLVVLCGSGNTGDHR